MSFQVFDARLKAPFSALVAGPSMSGKTHFVVRLLENWSNLVDTKLDHIVWCYGQKTNILEDLQRKYAGKISLVEGLPEDIEKYLESGKNTLLVLDDSQSDVCESQQVADIFTKKCHHMGVCTVVIFQNLFCEGKHRKTIYRNATYLILFNSPLDHSLAYSLARKIYPNKSSLFLDIFKRATQMPYGYLFIDGTVTSPWASRFRTDIFNKYYQRVFVPVQP